MLGIQRKTKLIGAHEYTIQTHGAIKGRAILLRLVKVAGTSLSGLQTQGDLLAGIGSVISHLSEEDLTYMCDEFAGKTEVTLEGGGITQLPKVFDVHFSENYLEMVQWLAFAIEANFKGFFSDAAKEIKDVIARASQKKAK